jgi:hypothetical protein
VKGRVISGEMLVMRDATNRPILPPCDDENTRVGDMRLLLKTYLNELWGESITVFLTSL